MAERIQEITSDLAKLAADARERFAGFSAEQINWKPAEKSWSVGQCFGHLITTHSLYFPLLQQLGKGGTRASFWERHSPFSGFFGKFLIKSMHPDNQKKMKTSAKAQPSASDIDSRIVDHFCEHQAQLIDHLRRIPAEMDPAKTIITSPLLGFVTYSLDDCLTIFVVHGQRHLGQARRVTETAGFPA